MITASAWVRVTRILNRGILGGLLLCAACRDLTPPLPAGITDPAILRTPEGALSLYRGTLLKAVEATVEVLVTSGELTDELQRIDVGNPGNAGLVPTTADARNGRLSERQPAYNRLHGIRNNSIQAIAALRVYAPDAPASFRGELYAWRGYAEVMLAELYCSGIPLSTVDFDGDYTYQPGLSRDDVFTHAITLFDSALALSTDSVRIQHFARIGKARALLNLGQFSAAATVTSAVPDGYVYELTLPLQPSQTFVSLWASFQSVSDTEGTNGLPFRSAGDPRALVRSNGKLQFVNDSIWVPLKYDGEVPAPQITIASAVEARLIEAEAALRDHRFAEWADKLNALRAVAITPAMASLPPDSVTLAPDAAADTMRTTVMFQERGFWLFLTGHRQGDLRRLIRQYGRDPEAVYPTGFMDPGGLTRYGTDITLAVPQSEQTLNPVYTGCFDREA